MPLFQGLVAFPITPADAGGRVDAEALRALLGRLTDAGVDSIGLLGSTGSYPYLTREERRRAVEIAVACVGGRAPILVGVGALRTDEAVRLGQDAAGAGADVGPDGAASAPHAVRAMAAAARVAERAAVRAERRCGAEWDTRSLSRGRKDATDSQ